MIQTNPNKPPLSHCENCHSRISQEQLELIKENQDAVFCSFCGKHLFLKRNFIGKQNSKKKFLTDTKISNTNQYKRGSFEYFLTIFAARFVYDSIIQSDLSLRPIESYVEKLAHALRIEFSEKKLNQEWLGVFRNNSKKKYKKRYKRFQTILKRNVEYQENFLIFSRSLIKSVLDLKNSEKELSTLKGIKRDIAEDLINRKLFELDKRFPKIFKQNLIIVFSRLIYIKIKYMAQKRDAKVSLIDLDHKVIVKMAESIKNNIITFTKINPEYLNKLYGITSKQFDIAYQNLRTELNVNIIYSESFKYFLQQVIKKVNLLLSCKKEKASLRNFEQVILLEIKNLEIKYIENEELIIQNENIKAKDDLERKVRERTLQLLFPYEDYKFQPRIPRDRNDIVSNNIPFDSLQTFAVTEERTRILKLLNKKGVREKRFFHGGHPCDFKWVPSRIENVFIPKEIRDLLKNYFLYLMEGSDFGIFSSNIRSFPCSSFKIRYLKHNSKKLIRERLIKNNMIVELNSELPDIPSFFKDLMSSVKKIEAFMREYDEANMSRHSRLEELILCSNENSLAIELPIWDITTYITGHIDLILYNFTREKLTFYVCDYKPDIEKKYDFVSSIPQLCFYVKILKKVLKFPQEIEFKGLILNKSNCWIFDSNIINDIRDLIEEFYNPHYFITFRDVFGNVQDYSLMNWTLLHKFSSLNNLDIPDFLSSIKFEFSKILSLKAGSYPEIGDQIIELIDNLKVKCNPLQIESLKELESAIDCLYNLDFHKADHDILKEFFQLFQFDLHLWEDNLTDFNKDFLKKIHSLQKICHVYNSQFNPKMVNHGEYYKKVLVAIYLITEKFSEREYFSKKFINSNLNFNNNRDKLIQYGLVEKIGYGRTDRNKKIFKVYKLTEKGRTISQIIIKNWTKNFLKKFNLFFKKVKSDYEEYKGVIQSSFIIFFDKNFNLSEFCLDELKVDFSEYFAINDGYFPSIGDTWKKYLILIGFFVDFKKNQLNIREQVVTFTKNELKEFNLFSNKDATITPHLIKLSDMGFINIIIIDSNLMKLAFFLTNKGEEEVARLPTLYDLISIEGETEIDKDIYEKIHYDYNYFLIDPKDSNNLKRLKNIFTQEDKIDNNKTFKNNQIQHEFDIPLQINENLFTHKTRWKLWLNLSYYVSSQTSDGVFTSTSIMDNTSYSNVMVTKALNRLVEKNLLNKEKRYSNEFRAGKNFYCLTDIGIKKAKESPNFNDMILKSDIPIIDNSLFKRGENWKKNLILASYASTFSLDGEINTRLMGKILNINVDSAGEVLKDLYERGFLDRKLNRKVKKHYSYFIINKGSKELEHLPPYGDILKYRKISKK